MTFKDLTVNVDWYFKKVFIFTETFGQPTPDLTDFELIDPKLKELRLNLLEEEFNELMVARKQNNVVEVADAIADSLYVAYGMGVSYGWELQYIIPYTPEYDKYFEYIIDNFEYVKYYHTIEPNGKKARKYLRKYIESLILYSYFSLIPIRECFAEVHRSNMSKIAPTLKIAEDSVKKLKPVKCSIKEINGGFLIIRDEDNKILKPINYSKTNFSNILNVNRVKLDYYEDKFTKSIEKLWDKEMKAKYKDGIQPRYKKFR